jgi:hypothetical protein
MVVLPRPWRFTPAGSAPWWKSVCCRIGGSSPFRESYLRELLAPPSANTLAAAAIAAA